ncbi:hypothetical protein ACSIGC_08875 [Tenacibaculum sp. ZS6-P6]|uniref:hypothetical protein n=1 Tax=Tenacibaculum sp. ZS6-P6 TaxID=3447503 RepID=UPI003F996720
MKKSILNLGKFLNKADQRKIKGGIIANCPTYEPSKCTACGGHPLANGCCLGSRETHFCLSGIHP